MLTREEDIQEEIQEGLTIDSYLLDTFYQPVVMVLVV